MTILTRAIAIVCLAMSAGATAQQVTLGQLMDAEAQLTLKKIHDELTKSESGSKAPIVVPVLAPMPPRRPETLSVFGTNDSYEAEILINGGTYSVRPGSRVEEYTVATVTPKGVELFKYVPMPRPRNKKSGQPVNEKVTVFAPLNLH